jgi:hypothetical protein
VRHFGIPEEPPGTKLRPLRFACAFGLRCGEKSEDKRAINLGPSGHNTLKVL